MRKDPNTGAMSGMSYDYINAIGKELGLKIEWTEETGWGTYAEGLNTGRYDMMCGLVWASGERAKSALLTRPAAYQALVAFAREDNSRFDQSLSSLDKPDVSIAVVDGDPTQTVREELFPNAREVALSASTDSATYLLTVATKKADIVLADEAVIKHYNEQAEVKLKPVGNGQPVRMFANVYVVRNGEFQLKYLIDTAIDILNTSRMAQKIIAPYHPVFSPVTPGYAPL